MEELKTKFLFLNKSASLAYDFLQSFEYPWQALPFIKDYITELGATLPTEEYEEISPQVWVARDSRVEKSAYVGAPCIVCHGAQVRHCAYIRGSALVGQGAVVGNSTELKNCILFGGAAVPHYNYVGDSILGYCAHMGAGSITSNVKGDKGIVKILGKVDTGLSKVGGFLGDFAEIGCGAVLNPGTVVGVGARVYPLSSVRGHVPAYHIYKGKGEVTKICAE